MNVSRRIVLHFPPNMTGQPVVCRLVKDYDKGIKYLTETGIEIQSLSQDVVRDEARCTHCGACITICPTEAFVLEPRTRKVHFDHNKCVVCGLCVKACPPRAMILYF